jgi:ATP-binding cassette subfamily B multidrug efflux pump
MFKRFEGFTQAFPLEEPQQPPTTLWAFCRHYTKGFITPLIFIALLSTTIAVIEVSLFGFMGRLVDWLSTNNPTTFWHDNQSTLVLLALLIVVGVPILISIHSLLVHQSMFGNYPMSIRWLAHRYLLKQSISFYQDEFAGRIATKVMQTALAIRETVMKAVDVFVYILVYVTAILVILADSDWRLMLPMLIWLIIYTGIQIFFVPKLKHISSLQADARSTMTGRLVDSYTNIQTVKLFSHHRRETHYAQKSMEGFLDTVYYQMRLVTGFNISVEVANYLLLFFIAAISIYLWSHQLITVGEIAVAVSLSLRINGMSHWIMWEVGALFENIGTVVDGMHSISRTINVKDKPNASPLQITRGEIEFNDVTFHYGESIHVIDHLNLKIHPGEKVGIVGRSGAGKSTLVNLLLRFHDVESGTIRIDGQAIDQVTQDSLRGAIGMVTQDTSLLHRSIRENILYGLPDASDEAMLKAAQQAHAHEFIETLSDPYGNSGYDAQVGERGVKLSGGQRQRIAIARVLLKNAPILILDEATSALDSEVESAIQESLYQLMEGKTVIAIAHRLSTIAAMDRLIIVEQGKIVEQGTHQALLAQNGIYAHLWKHQTGGFIAEH